MTHRYPGLTLVSHKQLTRNAPIRPLAAPAQVVLPLQMHRHCQLLPVVCVGQSVLMGEVIAKPEAQDPTAAWLHAPISGVVHAITDITTQCGTGTAIVIANDFRDARTPMLARADIATLTRQQICQQLAQGGLVGMGGAGFSTARKLSSAQRPIEVLILNGVECEPYITCDDRLMREHADDLIQGGLLLQQACGAEQVMIAIESDKPEALASINSAIQAHGAMKHWQVISVPAAYPSGDEGQLIRRLLQREIPRGGLPADIGVIVHNVATAAASARWWFHGEPLIDRIVTITGHGIATPGNVRVRIGTAVTQVATECGGMQSGAQLIQGGAMMGLPINLESAVITKTSNCILVANQIDMPPKPSEQPCIRCGDCMHACPVGLLPQQLLLHTRHGHDSALRQLGLADCIECGCCDYVCPSHIRLATLFHDAKGLLT